MMAAAALTRLIRRGNKPETRFLRPLATWPPPPHHGSPAGPIDTSDPRVRISNLQYENVKRLAAELGDEILKLHRAVDMKINAAKSDCVSRCAKARHDATVFGIGTLLTAAVAATVLKEVVG
ncbi:uncharacterized protein LOC130135485 [Syzygium oleosum]|uniref:uncharacterized protein LOC130135485 n=1 Tax=Syzygium oleosum TaxID=219896 RepID=UPI0024BB4BE9|nr:uncharacterized protein LOC130135485 [Syzygium oleosum]